MKYVINETELQILLEVQKLVNLEEQVLLKDDEIEIPETVISEVISSVSDRILFLLRSDSSANAKLIFINYLKENLKSERFLKIAQSILDRHELKEMDESTSDKNRITEETPEPILHIMQHLAAYGNAINDLLGRSFYTQYFISQYLVYRINEGRFVFESKKINKTELYELVYGTADSNYRILNKMIDVQKAHKSIFKGKLSEMISLDTAKKRMQQVISSTHKEGTMNQSEELNVFQQNALLINFLIYKTSYQRFLSNPATQRVPDTRTFGEIKDVIEEFFQKYPISGVEDKLFLKTVSEDTYHFAVFNAITRLTTAVMGAMNEVILENRQYDSLSTLFIIDQMIDSVPAYTSAWFRKHQEIIAEIDKFSKFPEIQKVVLEAVKDEEALNYAKQTMLDMFSKFDNLQQDSENYDFVEETFKKIVKDYYNDGENKTAYAK